MLVKIPSSKDLELCKSHHLSVSLVDQDVESGEVLEDLRSDSLPPPSQEGRLVGEAEELLVPSGDGVLGQRVPDLAHLAGRVADVLLRALVRTLVLVLHGAVAPVQDLQKIDR